MDIKRNNSGGLFLLVFAIIAISILMGGGSFSSAETDGGDGEIGIEGVSEKRIAALISCKGLIDDGLYQSIKRRTAEAAEAGATYMIYEIQTYGGLVKSGDDISKYFILEAGKKYHTVAYVTTEAISAGAMISVACKDIVMLEHTTIGDCAPIMLGGKLEGVEREKAESFIRAAFVRAAEANDYPVALLKAMVSQQLEVYKVKNKQTGKLEFFETMDLPDDPNMYDLKGKRIAVKEGELLTLTAARAKEYGVARAIVDDVDGVLEFLAERDGVEFADDVIEFETLWSEQMVRWISSPAVMSVLVLLAMLGAYIELNSPGVGLPGGVAVICVIIIIGSKYLIGMANWVEIAVFMIGVILLLVEIFVLPGFGLAGAAGIICIFAGLFGMLVKNPPEKLPWPTTEVDWDLFSQGLYGLIGGCVGFFLCMWLLGRYLPKIGFLSGLILAPSKAGAESERAVSITAPPASMELGINIGDVGVVTNALRPAGDALFGDATVDVVAQGQFLEKGERVEIVEIHGNRVVVKAVEG